MRRRYLLSLLLLSGFSGLAYELLWVRLLAPNMGSTTLSFATVLSVFFGGLAVGSRWAGSALERSKRPVRMYALLEGATGVLGLALYPLMKSSGWAFSLVEASAGPAAVALRLAIAAVLLLPPTLLMGATLPFVCQAVIAENDQTGRGTALIYGLNTLGACLGVYFVTFHLLPSIGVFWSTVVAAAVNFIVAGVAAFGSSRDDGPATSAAAATSSTPPAQSEPQAAEPSAADPRVASLVALAAFVGGFTATGAQVVWSRLFSITLRGTTYGIGAVLTTVLVGIGLGSLWAAALTRRSRTLVNTYGWVQVLLVASFAAFGPLFTVYDYVNTTLSEGGFTQTGLVHAQLVSTGLMLLASTLASGSALPLLVALLEHRAANAGAALSRVYASNTAGCILGSLAGGYVLLPNLGTNNTLFLMALLLVMAAVPFLVFLGHERRLLSLGQLAALCVAVAIFPGFDAKLLSRPTLAGDFFSTARARQAAAATIDFLYEGDIATVAVTKTEDDSRALMLNGLGQGSRRMSPPYFPFESVLVGAMPWAHSPKADKGLVIGAGAGGTVQSLLDLGVAHLEVAELERGVIDAVDHIWGDASPLRDARVQVIENDARHHLLVSERRHPHSYDFITSMPAHPWVASALFTREFFELAARNLAPGGVFATWFGTTQMDDVGVEALFGAFGTAFPHFIAYWVPEAGAFYLVGSTAPFALDAARVDALERHPVFEGFVTRPNFNYLFARVVAASPPAGWTPSAIRIATDDNALVEFHGGLYTQRPTQRYDFFPKRSLPLERVTQLDPTHLEAAIEEALGSPNARLPARPRSREALAMLGDLAPALEPDLRAYTEGRLALTERKPDAARAAFAKLQSDRLKQRAAKFTAFSEQQADARLAALEAIPERSADVVLATLAMKPTVEQGLAPFPAPSPTDDPAQWLLVPPDEAKAAASDPAQSAQLLRRLREFGAANLWERCRAWGVRAGWLDVARDCALSVEPARRGEATALARQAVRAGSAGRYGEALKQLVRANQVAPLASADLLLLLRTAQKQQAPDVISSVEHSLKVRGYTQATLDALKAYYRAADAEERAPVDAGVPAQPSP